MEASKAPPEKGKLGNHPFNQLFWGRSKLFVFWHLECNILDISMKCHHEKPWKQADNTHKTPHATSATPGTPNSFIKFSCTTAGKNVCVILEAELFDWGLLEILRCMSLRCKLQIPAHLCWVFICKLQSIVDVYSKLFYCTSNIRDFMSITHVDSLLNTTKYQSTHNSQCTPAAGPHKIARPLAPQVQLWVAHWRRFRVGKMGKSSCPVQLQASQGGSSNLAHSASKLTPLGKMLHQKSTKKMCLEKQHISNRHLSLTCQWLISHLTLMVKDPGQEFYTNLTDPASLDTTSVCFLSCCLLPPFRRKADTFPSESCIDAFTLILETEWFRGESRRQTLWGEIEGTKWKMIL